MKNKKNLKLLIIYFLVLKQMNITNQKGICGIIWELYQLRKINTHELNLIRTDFHKRKPKWYNSIFWWNLDYLRFCDNGYWWFLDSLQRKKFILHIIKKL